MCKQLAESEQAREKAALERKRTQSSLDHVAAERAHLRGQLVGVQHASQQQV